MLRSLAHLSDLHIGRDRATDLAATRLAALIAASGVDQVLVTGDVTHRGKASELARFRDAFGPLLERGRLLVVPGNHDRLGDDVSRAWMERRVEACSRPGLHVVRIDSTADHNRSLLTPGGVLTREEIRAAGDALAAAPADALRVVMLHHHVVRLPHDCVYERLSSLLGWRGGDELALGPELVRRVMGACDFVLHGHRHDEGEIRPDARLPLRIVNAGSSTGSSRVRVIVHSGRTVVSEHWLDASPACSAPALRDAAAA